MNPLSPLTYFCRHKRQMLLLAGLVSLMTLGICIMVRLLDSVPENYQIAVNYLFDVSLVTPKGPEFDPHAVAEIRSHPGVDQVILEKGLDISLPPLITEHHIFGLSEADMHMLLEAASLQLKEDHLPRQSTNEMVLSQEMVNGLGLQIGDTIDRTKGRDWSGESTYDSIPIPLELVGILEAERANSEVRLGIVSYEFVANHELFGPPWNSGLIVIPRDGYKSEVSQFLEAEVASASISVRTYDLFVEKAAGLSLFFYLIFGVVDLVVAIVIALVVGVINQIARSKRLQEFGVLNALGLSKTKLVRRSILEAAGTTAIGWGAGIALAWLLFAVLKAGFYQPRGMVLNLADLTPIWFSLLIPLVTAAVVAFSTRRTFARLDAVAIVEQGLLSTESGNQPKAVKRSSANPLSSKTFYQRHRRRGLIFVVSMGLMILAVSFPAFLFAPMGDAMQVFAEPLRQIGIVTPRMDVFVVPGLAAQVRTHPAVDQVIPAVALSLDVSVPPMSWPTMYMVFQKTT